jgi:predicted O-methyltransferase YrrM
MDTINREYIQTYLHSLIKSEEESLEKFRLDCIENHRPIIQKEVAQLIKVLLNITKPKKILEIGTNVGFSSIFMCKALANKVDILSIEISKDIYEKALENIKIFECEKNIRLINDDASQALEYINESNFDIAFIDASKSHYTEFLDKLLKILSSDGIIICDNVLYNGMIANDELVEKRKKTIVKNMRKFFQYISTDDRFETSIIPIGDGVAIIKLK